MTTKQLSLYFFVVHLVLTFIMAAILTGLNVAFDVEIGGSGPFIGVLIGAIILAGRKFASVEDAPPGGGRYWRLALGMTAGALAGNFISVIVAGGLIAPDLFVAADESGRAVTFILIVLAIVGAVQLAVIRFAFAYFSRREIEARIAAKRDQF